MRPVLFVILAIFLTSSVFAASDIIGGIYPVSVVLSANDDAKGLNITNVSYMYADYFIGDGSLLTGITATNLTLGNHTISNWNETNIDTLQTVTDRESTTTNDITIANDVNTNLGLTVQNDDSEGNPFWSLRNDYGGEKSLNGLVYGKNTTFTPIGDYDKEDSVRIWSVGSHFILDTFGGAYDLVFAPQGVVNVLSGLMLNGTTIDDWDDVNITAPTPSLQSVTDIGATTNNSITIGGLTDTSKTEGSVLFAGSGGLISEDNDGVFFDSANVRLGLVTDSPSYDLSFGASTGTRTTETG